MCFNQMDEEVCVIREAQNGNKQAAEWIVKRYTPLLYALVRRLGITQNGRDELIQAGYLGMMRAMHGYKMEYTVRFSTYALPWILGEIRSALRKNQDQCSMLPLEEFKKDEKRSLLEVVCGKSGIDVEKVDLRMALEELENDERLLICLRYFRDKTQKETALLLHKSQAQVSRMEQKILDALHARLS